MELTYKQQAFINEYLKDYNGTRAYKAAYGENLTDNVASTSASRLIKRPKIKNKIKEEMQKLEKRSLIKIDDDIMESLMEAYDGDERVIKRVINRAIRNFLPKGHVTAEEIEEKLKRENIGSGTRYRVLARAGFKCQACGRKPSKNNNITLDIDHIQPFSKGGTDHIDNLQVLCHECNRSKGNRFEVNHNIGWDVEEVDENKLQLKIDINI